MKYLILAVAIVTGIVYAETKEIKTTKVTFNQNGQPVSVAYVGGVVKNVTVTAINSNGTTNQIPYTITVITNTVNNVSK